MPDGWAIRHFGSLNFDGEADDDQDGLTNAEEATLGTNPQEQDSNFDGIADNEDRDGDGVIDALEAVPTDPDLTFARAPESRYIPFALPGKAVGLTDAGLVLLADIENNPVVWARGRFWTPKMPATGNGGSSAHHGELYDKLTPIAISDHVPSGSPPNTVGTALLQAEETAFVPGVHKTICSAVWAITLLPDGDPSLDEWNESLSAPVLMRHLPYNGSSPRRPVGQAGYRVTEYNAEYVDNFGRAYGSQTGGADNNPQMSVPPPVYFLRSLQWSAPSATPTQAGNILPGRTNPGFSNAVYSGLHYGGHLPDVQFPNGINWLTTEPFKWRFHRHVSQGGRRIVGHERRNGSTIGEVEGAVPSYELFDEAGHAYPSLYAPMRPPHPGFEKDAALALNGITDMPWPDATTPVHAAPRPNGPLLYGSYLPTGASDSQSAIWVKGGEGWLLKPLQQLDPPASIVTGNAKGEFLTETRQLWRNNHWIPLQSLVLDSPSLNTFTPTHINSHGIITLNNVISEGGLALLPIDIVVDHNRDGKLDSADARPNQLPEQGAYDSAGAFRQKGAIVWANLDYDEENVASGKPVPDTIRFWHNGLTFEHSNEDFVVRNGERTITPYPDGYEAPPASEVRSPCSDVAPIKLSRFNSLPAAYKVLLRVARVEDLKAFHFYKRIPDFSKNDSQETAIWGAFQQSAAPWNGGTHIIDNRTIDLTKWVNENAGNYVGHQQTRRTADAPFVFGIETMLYKGMKYDFSGGTGGQEFDGNLDFTLILKDAQGQETEIDKFRLTCLCLPAFPGARGFGKWSQGGRGGEVYIVNSLAASGVGTLNHAMQNRKRIKNLDGSDSTRLLPRTIVFATSGLIDLGPHGHATAEGGSLTIAGQSAPGDGITIKNGNLKFGRSYSKDAAGNQVLPSQDEFRRASDYVVRYLRMRRAPTGGSTQPNNPDAVSVNSATRFIIDHCSIAWGLDGGLDVNVLERAKNAVGEKVGSLPNEQQEMDITAQWCLVNQTLLGSLQRRAVARQAWRPLFPDRLLHVQQRRAQPCLCPFGGCSC